VRDDRAGLDVDDQRGDGRTVAIDEVRIMRTTGHVAIFTADRSRLLGSVSVPRSDEERRTTVTLNQPVTGTTRLLAVLYGDNGDGRFDLAVDPAVVEADGDEDFTYSRG
jgi:hypothetical protein